MTGMPSPTDSLSVVVPVFNEAENILPLVGEIHAALEAAKVSFEVIYVDDGSTDATGERLALARDRFPRLRVVGLRENCGQSAATWAGVKAAHAHWIVTLDGDGQNDPADIPKLISAAEAEGRSGPTPLVAGLRRHRRDNWLRRLSSRLANRVRSRLLKDGTPDTGCALKLFEREAFLALPYFDHMHRFLPALFRRHGTNVVLVDVGHRARTRGVSKYGIGNRLWVGIVDLVGVMWLQRRMKSPEIEYED